MRWLAFSYAAWLHNNRYGITEPCFYERIFQHIHGSLSQSRPIPRQWSQEGETDTIGNAIFKALRAEIEQYWIEVANHYRTLEVNRLKQLHQDLIHQAKMLDKNTDVHTILRLGNRKLRLGLEGQLGGAMLLLTMAEILRQATEEVFSMQLPTNCATRLRNQKEWACLLAREEVKKPMCIP